MGDTLLGFKYVREREERNGGRQRETVRVKRENGKRGVTIV
jgi:hypothetical protein